MVLEGQLREQGRKSDVKACCGGGMKGLLQAMGGGMKGPTGEREREKEGGTQLIRRAAVQPRGYLREPSERLSLGY